MVWRQSAGREIVPLTNGGQHPLAASLYGEIGAYHAQAALSAGKLNNCFNFTEEGNKKLDKNSRQNYTIPLRQSFLL